MSLSRPPRIDAARNRQTLLSSAARVFAANECEPSMRAVAREAHMGMATLYRHFPTREALVAAVYQDQFERLTSGAQALLSEFRPADALRRWMDLFAGWLATKHGMLDTLLAMMDAGQISHTETREQLLAAIASILDAGRDAGEIRPDANAEDIAASLIGIFTVAGTPAQRPQAERLLDLLMDGLKYTEDT